MLTASDLFTLAQVVTCLHLQATTFLCLK